MIFSGDMISKPKALDLACQNMIKQKR